MRPDTEGVHPRFRKDADHTNACTRPYSGRPTSLRLATDHELQQEEGNSLGPGTDSTYGVRSFDADDGNVPPQKADTRHPAATEQSKEDVDGNRRAFVFNSLSRTHSRSTTAGENLDEDYQQPSDSSPSRNPLVPQVPSVAHSLASLSLDSQGPLSSLPSSSKSTSHRSFRPSDDESLDEAASQAIASSSEDEDDPLPDIQDSAPQLIMPSIKMPSRRPFTDRGKAMGRLKILIAGDSGMQSLVLG